MERRVFFSFHYERDAWRAAVVRNHWVSKEDRESAGYFDSASWEEVKKKGEPAIKKWIADNLKGTTVTVVLIGAETSSRKWVRYELRESHKKGNGMFGVYIHNIKDQEGKKDKHGSIHFGEICKDEKGEPVYFWKLYPTYDWVNDNGYNNFSDWVEQAAKKAGK
jgi:hypothetical protein